jgi:hypothetical protein
MALIKPEQLRSGSYEISGSFSGSFQGDGSGLNNVTASLAPNYTLTSSFNIFTSSYIQDSSSFDTRILNNSSSIDLLSGSFDSFTQTYNTGSFTGSFIGDGSQLTGIISSKWSGSNPISRESDVDVSGSFRVSGSIDVTKQLTAQTVAINTTGSFTATLISNALTSSNNYYFPNKQGTLALREDLPTAGSGLTQVITTPDTFKLGGIVTENTTLVDDSNTYNLSLNGPNLYLYKADDNSAPTIRLNRASGSASTPLPPPAFGYLGVISAGGYDSGVLPGSAALIFQASENFTTSSRGTDLFFNTTPNGTNIPIRRLTIYNDGTVNISGSLIVTGSINSPSITGSLFGTASWAVNAQTASYVETAQTASYVLQAVSSSFASSGTGEFTGSFSGSFIGDGSQLTGIVSSKWSGSNPITRDSSVEITGSFKVAGQTTFTTTGSGTLKVQGSGSAQPLFLVTGSIGELLSVIDQDDPNEPLLIVSGSAGQLFVVENSTTGSLLQIYDTGSNSIFSVEDNGNIMYGVSSSIFSTQQISILATASYQTIYDIQTGSYSGAFVNYTAISSSNARAGQLMSVWINGTSSYTETTTTDIGDTSQIAFDVVMTGSVARIAVSASLTTGWQVKTTLNIL